MSTSEAAFDRAAIDRAALDALFVEARTANTFLDEPVDDDTLRAIYDLAKLPPTSMNANPMRVAFITSPEAKQRLYPYVPDLNLSKVTSAPVNAIMAIDTEFHEKFAELFPHQAHRREMFLDPEVRLPFAEFNTWLGIAYFVMAIRSFGLAAGPIGAFDKEGVDREFFGGTTWKTLLMLNIGKPGPDAWYPRLPRLSAEDATVIL